MAKRRSKKSQKKVVYRSFRPAYKAHPLFHAIVVLVLLGLLGIILYSLPIAKKVQTGLADNVRTTTPYPEKLNWVNFSDSYDKELQFSMEIPFPGPYCSGCFGGAGGVTNMRLTHVDGGHFMSDSPFIRTTDWLLNSDIFLGGHYLEGTYLGVPQGNFYDALSQQKEGVPFLLYDEKKRAFTTVRLPDRFIEGTRFLIFKTDLNSGEIKNAKRTFTIFQRKNFTVFLSFEYNNKLYENAFGHMLDTFSFSQRPDNYYDVLKKVYGITIVR